LNIIFGEQILGKDGLPNNYFIISVNKKEILWKITISAAS